jgi:uncharacterized Zn-binding protein involved in type VI secretion
MPAVQRNGDKYDNGGVINGGVASVRVNNLPVSVDGTTVLDTENTATKTATGSRSVRAGGIPINNGASGSKDVFIGGR